MIYNEWEHYYGWIYQTIDEIKFVRAIKQFCLSLDFFVNETLSANEDHALYIAIDEISEL